MRALLLLFVFIVSITGNAQDGEVSRIFDEFLALSVYNDINVKLIKGDKNEAKIRVKGIETDRVLTEIENGELSFKVDGGKFDEYTVNVELTYSGNLKSVKSNSDSDVMQDGIFKTDSLILESRMDGKITLYLDVKHVKAKALEGSALVLSGFANYIEGETQVNGTIDAFELEVEKAKMESSLKGTIKITVTEEIEATVSLNGYIGYKGNPAKKEINKNLGGKVEQL